MLTKNLLLSLIFSLGLGLVSAAHAGSDGAGSDSGGSGESSSGADGSEGGDDADVKKGTGSSNRNSRKGDIQEGDAPAGHPAVRAEKYMGDRD